MRKIYILSGPVRSGKTTKLLHFLQGKKNVFGIVAPVINNERYLLNIKTGEKKLLEIKNDVGDKASEHIGNYIFDKNVFDWANGILIEAIKQSPEWLIVDEFGPLEFKGKGLAASVDEIINTYEHLMNTNVIVVIRDSLVLPFIFKYKFIGFDLKWFFFEDE